MKARKFVSIYFKTVKATQGKKKKNTARYKVNTQLNEFPPERMLLKRGMGNGEWGMGNGEWGMGNGMIPGNGK